MCRTRRPVKISPFRNNVFFCAAKSASQRGKQKFFRHFQRICRHTKCGHIQRQLVSSTTLSLTVSTTSLERCGHSRKGHCKISKDPYANKFVAREQWCCLKASNSPNISSNMIGQFSRLNDCFQYKELQIVLNDISEKYSFAAID